MKLLHTSDWHLGIGYQTRSFREDQDYFIGQIAEIVKTYQVDGVLLCGDVYDRSVPNSDGILLYDKAMTMLCGELQVPVLVIAGNHDNAARLSSCRKLLANSGLTIVGELEADTPYIPMGNADIYMLPWISTEKVKSVYPGEAEEIHTIEDAYRVAVSYMQDTFRPGKKHILMAHAFIVNATTSTSDRSAEVGTATAVSASVFAEFDYVALGHIHGPQDIGDRIRYCGTPMKYSFGKEEAQEKSVTILDTDTMERTIVPVPALHERISLSGTLEEVLAGEDLTENQQKGYIRAHISDHYIGLETAASLRERYPNLLEYSGKSFESEEGTITLSVEELEQMSDNPEEIFKQFYMDTMNDRADEHLLTLFREALAIYERGEQE